MSRTLRYDPSGVYLPESGMTRNDAAALGALLEKLRDEICEIDCRMLAGDMATPPEKTPLDAAFYSLPESQLRAYEADRQGSPLAHILACTKRLMSEVDRVVVLGSSALTSGARGLLNACCQPHFNELSRGARGSRPRILFESDTLDNDRLQGLLHLLDAHRGQAASSIDESWGLVVLGQEGRVTEVTEAVRRLHQALITNCGDDMDKVRHRMISIVGPSYWRRDQADEFGCHEVFELPRGVGSRFSVLSTVGLIPAALMGINVMQLLAGAAAINEQFRMCKAPENIVLQVAAVNHLAVSKRGAHARVFCVWNAALESFGKWYEQLLAGSLGKRSKAAMPVTVVQPRELQTRHQQLLTGRHDQIIQHVVVEQTRFDPLVLERQANQSEQIDRSNPVTLPGLLADVARSADESLRTAGCLSTRLVMPQVDEYYMGQLYQWLMLATVVEGRLLGINPYG